MATPNSSAPTETPAGYWRRVLRPLFWWLLLVLVLFGIHTHQRLMEKTRLNFTVTLGGGPISLLDQATITFDGKPVLSGDNIPLGGHQFAVAHPKGETFSTNFFVWYGAHNFGNIDLKRATGTLSVTANPPAPVLSIHGPEFDVELTNSPGMTSSVPTDRYVITSRYAHWSRSDEASVSSGMTTTWPIAPRLGAAQITCNEADATGQFLQADGQVVETVTFPYSIWQLPEGIYTITAQHHNDVLSQKVVVTANATNQLSLDFLYGSAVLETEPPGAAVRTADGRYWGATPLKVLELIPGDWKFTLQQNGYETVTASLAIAADQVRSFHTNLISVNYTGSMKKAQQAMATEDYDTALTTVGAALLAKPGDAEALALQHNATGLGSLQHARKLGLQGDFMGGEKELATTLTIFPDNTEARDLLAEYKRREPEQIEQLRVERLNRPKKVFDALSAKTSDAELFESHELTTTKPVKEVVSAIATALQQVPPPFAIMENYSPAPENYVLRAKQTDTGILSASGYRICLIVCGQARDDETQIYFKLIEYKAKHNVTMPGLLAFRDDVSYVPMHPSRIPDMTDKLRAQVQAGVSNLTVRIQGAIGQTPPPSSP